MHYVPPKRPSIATGLHFVTRQTMATYTDYDKYTRSHKYRTVYNEHFLFDSHVSDDTAWRRICGRNYRIVAKIPWPQISQHPLVCPSGGHGVCCGSTHRRASTGADCHSMQKSHRKQFMCGKIVCTLATVWMVDVLSIFDGNSVETRALLWFETFGTPQISRWTTNVVVGRSNHECLELNGTYSLVYTDYANKFGENINTTKENTENIRH
jgi:hypothetical protein